MEQGPFDHSVCYLRRRRQAGPGGTAWAFSFHDANGGLLLEALFPELPKEAIVFEPGKPESPLLRLKAWRWFWWNGRYDVVDARTHAVLATLRRTGGIEGPDRRVIGRVGNATPLRRSAFQLFMTAVLSVMFATNDSSPLPVEEFRVEADRVTIGRLRRARLPFSTKPETMETADGGPLKTWLGRFRSAARNRLDAGGWLLDFSVDEGGAMDPRVRLAAALLRIQIEERYN